MLDENIMWSAAERVMGYLAENANMAIGLLIGAFLLTLAVGIFWKR